MPPQYLFHDQEDLVVTLKEKLSSRGNIILLLDYDGTLAPICKKPALACLSNAMKEILKSLQKSDRVTIAFVTGRSYRDIRRMVSLDNAIYVSNHGFQITWGKKRWVHPQIRNVAKLLQNVSLVLGNELSQFYLTTIENKKLTLSVHYRNEVKEKIPVLIRTVKGIVHDHIAFLKLTRGKKVIEVRPKINWNKGLAAVRLLSMLQKKTRDDSLVIYMGDDKTDEDVFKCIRETAVTVRIGRSKNTDAKYQLNSINEVELFLKMLNSILSKSNIN